MVTPLYDCIAIDYQAFYTNLIDKICMYMKRS